MIGQSMQSSVAGSEVITGAVFYARIRNLWRYGRAEIIEKSAYTRPRRPVGRLRIGRFHLYGYWIGESASVEKERGDHLDPKVTQVRRYRVDRRVFIHRHQSAGV